MSQEDEPANSDQKIDYDYDTQIVPLERMATEVDMVAEWLTQLQGDTLTLQDADTTIYFSLYDLIKAFERLPAIPTSAEVQHLGATMASHLPFTPAEQQALYERIATTRDASDWYEQASDGDIILIDRWRRKLVSWFNEDVRDDPENEGEQLLRDIAAFTKAVDHWLPPSSAAPPPSV
jgi:hypothetical protein